MKCVVFLMLATLLALSSADWHRVRSAFKDGIKWEITGDKVRGGTHGRGHAGLVPAVYQKRPTVTTTTVRRQPVAQTVYKARPVVPTVYQKQPTPTTLRGKGQFVPGVYKKERNSVGPHWKTKTVRTQQKTAYGVPKRQYYPVRH